MRVDGASEEHPSHDECHYSRGSMVTLAFAHSSDVNCVEVLLTVSALVIEATKVTEISGH